MQLHWSGWLGVIGSHKLVEKTRTMHVWQLYMYYGTTSTGA